MKTSTKAAAAKPKASAKASLPSQRKPLSPPKAPPPPDPAQEYDPSKGRRALHALIARYGKIDSDHRAAYDELISDAGRAALGAQTRAAGVVREAVAWGVQIDQAFRAYPALVKASYSEERFAYFLERIALLDDAVAAQRARRGDQESTRSTAQERESAAREARAALISKLRGFAGRREAEGKALTEAIGRTDDADALGSSIQRLGALGTSWLARKEKSAQIQCASAGLTASAVAAALAAGEALTGSASAATLAGRRPAADAPEVNLLEGAVLHEMDEAQRCFDEAHATTQIIARLSPGASTKHVLGARKATKPTTTEPSAGPAGSHSPPSSP